MLETVDVHESVRSAIEDVNPTLAPEMRVGTDADAVLYGRGSELDSLGLVTILAEIELRLEDDHDLYITIADEKAMSEERSPFRTVGALVAYVEKLVSTT